MNEECECVRKHLPLPMVLYSVLVDEQTIKVCPTTYFNLKILLTEYQTADKVPEGSVRKHFSGYVQDLALKLWRESKHDWPKLFN